MDDFIERQGPAFLAHLLRRLSDELVQAAQNWYPEAGVTAPPRTTSTLLALQEHGPLSVTELAVLLRQSHPLVITWIRELERLEFVQSGLDEKDRRRTILSLTRKGSNEVRRLREALATMGRVSQDLMDGGAPGLLDALWRMEHACRRVPFISQLREKKKHESEGRPPNHLHSAQR